MDTAVLPSGPWTRWVSSESEPSAATERSRTVRPKASEKATETSPSSSVVSVLWREPGGLKPPTEREPSGRRERSLTSPGRLAE